MIRNPVVLKAFSSFSEFFTRQIYFAQNSSQTIWLRHFLHFRDISNNQINFRHPIITQIGILINIFVTIIFFFVIFETRDTYFDLVLS